MKSSASELEKGAVSIPFSLNGGGLKPKNMCQGGYLKCFVYSMLKQYNKKLTIVYINTCNINYFIQV